MITHSETWTFGFIWGLIAGGIIMFCIMMLINNGVFA